MAETSASFAAGEAPPPSPPGSGDNVTLVSGTSFIVCAPDGDVHPGGVEGYYAADTRLLSRIELRVNGTSPRLVSHTETTPDTLRAVSIVGDPTAARLLVVRERSVNNEFRERIEIRNLRDDTEDVRLELDFGADFADLFEVKRGAVGRRGFVGSGPLDGALVLSYEHRGFRRRVRIVADQPGEILRDALRFDVTIPGHTPWETTVRGIPESDDRPVPATPRLSRPETDEWATSLPALRSPRHDLETAWRRAGADLGSLRLVDDSSGRTVVAAGVPWFMALFGRDSLIAGWQSLPLGPSLALGSLHALAVRQGTRHDGRSGESPGKILHELRVGEVVQHESGWGEVYYGSVDVTPLFVMTLAETWRWGAPEAEIRPLLDAAEAAVGWILGPGDADGDGFVEYDATDPERGLVNQGWKDSHDGIRHRDGSLPKPPVALVEVQGYCYGALVGLADMREHFGTGDPAPLREEAARLRDAVDAAFWMEDEETFAVALDGAGRQVGSVTSNAAHLLWTGAVRDGRAQATAARLLRADCASGFGLRTLSSANGGYNPMSYHAGSVWPHDTSLAAAGMYRYGLTEEAGALTQAVLDAAAAFGGRLPELFGGFDRVEFAEPVPYPTSCSPQAWAAGTPLLLVRSMLGLDPDVPAGRLSLRPRLPHGLEFKLSGVRIGDGRLSLYARGDEVEVIEAPPDLAVEVS